MADRTVSYVFRGNFSNLMGGLAAGGRAVGDFGNKLTALDKDGAKMRRSFDSVGASAGRVGLVAAAGLGAVVLATANFDKAMSNVQAATHETAENMEELRAAAVKAGADTAFSASEAAAGIENLAKAGVSTKDILGGGLKGALDLAAAGSLEVAQAGEIAATAMNQFGLEGKDIPHIADLLAAAAGKAQGEVTDMALSLKYVGPVAAQMGVSIEETTGAIAELASQGILGDQAGTALRGMLTSLTSPSKIAAQTMKNLGIEMYDANGQFVGLNGIAGQLHDAMGNLTAAERDQALGRIFGNEQITAARILYAGGAQDVDKWTRAVNDQGYAAETASIKLDNLAGDVEAFKGSLETALIGSGEGSQGVLRKIVQGATDAVNAFNKLPPAAQNTTSALVGITAVTGGALWFGSKVIRGISETREALTNLGVTANHTRTTMTAIGKGIEFAAVLASISLIADGVDAIFNTRFDETNLSRNLEALSRGDAVDNLDKIGEKVRTVNAEISKGVDKVFGFLPGDTAVASAGKELEKIDQALASMVEGGQAEMAASAFAEIEKQARELGVSTEDVAGSFDQYQLALENAGHNTDITKVSIFGLTVAQDSLVGSTDGLTKAQRRAKDSAEKQAKALRESREAANETARSFVGLGDSLNDTKTTLGGWLKDLEKQAEALRDFRLNAKKAAKEGLNEGLIKSLQEAGPEGALRMKQLANATDAEIARANKAWRKGQREIRLYTSAVGGVPKNAGTNFKLTGMDEAMRQLGILQAALARIHDKSVNITVNQKYNDPAGAKSADGGTVPRSGMSYADRYPYLLADGEEVISNRYGQADRNRALLKAINAGYLADGGTVRPYDAPRFGDGGTARYMQITSPRAGGPTSMVVTGTLQTPWGPAHIEGLARDVARAEIDADRRFEKTRRGQ